MVLDEPTKIDTHVSVDDIVFIVDQETIDLIGDSINIDYQDPYGFRLSNNEEVLSYRLKLMKETVKNINNNQH